MAAACSARGRAIAGPRGERVSVLPRERRGPAGEVSGPNNLLSARRETGWDEGEEFVARDDGLRGGDVRGEVAVVVVEGDALAQQRVRSLERRARGERTAEIDPLSSRQQLDRDHAAGVLRHRTEPAGREGRHADVVLLVG